MELLVGSNSQHLDAYAHSVLRKNERVGQYVICTLYFEDVGIYVLFD
jgi:hypothetical protein